MMIPPSSTATSATTADTQQDAVPCLVAIGRLQVTSSPSCSDLLNQSSPTEFTSRHSVDGTFTFVDQRYGSCMSDVNGVTDFICASITTTQ